MQPTIEFDRPSIPKESTSNSELNTAASMSRRSALSLISRLAAVCGVAPHVAFETFAAPPVVAVTSEVATPVVSMFDAIFQEQGVCRSFSVLLDGVIAHDGTVRIGFDRDRKRWDFEIPREDRAAGEAHDLLRFNSAIYDMLDFAHKNLSENRRVFPRIEVVRAAQSFFMPQAEIDSNFEFIGGFFHEYDDRGTEITTWKTTSDIDEWLRRHFPGGISEEARTKWHQAFNRREENFKLYFESAYSREDEKRIFGDTPASSELDREERARCMFNLKSARTMENLSAIETIEDRLASVCGKHADSEGMQALNSVFAEGLDTVTGRPDFSLKKRFWNLALQCARGTGVLSSETSKELMEIEATLGNATPGVTLDRSQRTIALVRRGLEEQRHAKTAKQAESSSNEVQESLSHQRASDEGSHHLDKSGATPEGVAPSDEQLS